jgi:hypothetical protein
MLNSDLMERPDSHGGIQVVSYFAHTGQREIVKLDALPFVNCELCDLVV